MKPLCQKNTGKTVNLYTFRFLFEKIFEKKILKLAAQK